MAIMAIKRDKRKIDKFINCYYYILCNVLDSLQTHEKMILSSQNENKIFISWHAGTQVVFKIIIMFNSKNRRQTNINYLAYLTVSNRSISVLSAGESEGSRLILIRPKKLLFGCINT